MLTEQASEREQQSLSAGGNQCLTDPTWQRDARTTVSQATSGATDTLPGT